MKASQMKTSQAQASQTKSKNDQMNKFIRIQQEQAIRTLTNVRDNMVTPSEKIIKKNSETIENCLNQK